MNDSPLPLAAFSHIVICELCGFSVNTRVQPEMLKGWGQRMEQIDRGVVVPTGSICDICMAKARVENP